MKISKTPKRALAVLIALVMMFALLQTAFAAGPHEYESFPIRAANGVDLVADEDTLYIVEFRQNPTNKLITATFMIKNGNTTEALTINGVSIEVTFDDRVSPYMYNPVTDGASHTYDSTRKYEGGFTNSVDEFKKFCYTPNKKLVTIGSQTAIRNDDTGRYIGTRITSSPDPDISDPNVPNPSTISIPPSSTLTVAHLYFMPADGTSAMDLDMFNYQFLSGQMDRSLGTTRLSTWIGNGTYFLYADVRTAQTGEYYILNPQSFKLHMVRPKPEVSANNTTRTITGYNSATMEWSYTEAGPYTAGTPVVKDEAHTIYVRGRGDSAYSGNDDVYGDYKMYLPSTEVAEVTFTAGSAKEHMADPSITKIGENLVSTDGKTRVGDIIKYTITVSNVGKAGSTLVDAIVTDYINDFVILDENSVESDADTTYDDGLLTAWLGDIQVGQTRTITFRVTVATNAYGRDIANSATVTGKDGNGSDADILEKTVIEEGGERRVEGDQSSKPTVNPVTAGDATISGTGVPGALIEVKLPDSSNVLIAYVDYNGRWSVDVPVDRRPVAGQKIVAVQTEEGKGTSDPVEVIVGLANTGTTVIVTFDPNGGTVNGAATKTVIVGEPYGTLPTASRSGNYYFDGWYTQRTGGTLVWSTSIVTSSVNHTLYAHWFYLDEVNTRFTVTFHSNYAPEYVIATVSNISPGSSVGSSNMPANPVRTGYAFAGWNTSMTGAGTNFTAATIVNNNVRVYAQWRGADDVIINPTNPPITGFLSDHVVYIQGYPDHSMKPDQPITRAEVAIIFFRLLSNPDKNTPRVSAFSDVPNGAWYTQAISYLASVEILLGYPGGTFQPNQQITRAEFAAVASRFDQLADTQTNAFPDVQDHWAVQFINSAYAKGWVSGYPDGTFKPQQNITRAETVTVVNKMLERKVREDNIPGDATRFTDIYGHWAYADIMEASNAHDYIRRDDRYETWVLK